TDNEAKVQAAFNILAKDKTVLMIAHRLSTVTNADKIVVLADETVAEQGKPNELLNKNGLYSHMVKLQTESQGWVLG
ncbi:MAG: ABC transporter ATP-binding protein, partial [Oscillospiraceae bacterium]|nr:ABC transporter ATP-binding protein [Oscillospiraceae bacterium]